MTDTANPHCRLRSAKPKMQIVPKSSNIDDYRTLMHKRVDLLCDSFNDFETPNHNLAAMAMVVIAMGGSYSASRQIEENTGYGGKLFPAIVAEALRCEVMDEMAIDIFNGNLK